MLGLRLGFWLTTPYFTFLIKKQELSGQVIIYLTGQLIIIVLILLCLPLLSLVSQLFPVNPQVQLQVYESIPS